MKREPMRSGKLVIAEGGGPTVVINQSLVGAVLEARLFPQIEQIYGARYGVRGIVNEDFVDLSGETRANLEAIAATPASALGSTRDKPDLAYCRNILALLKAHGVSWFLYIGGNDTAETVRIVSEEAERLGFGLERFRPAQAFVAPLLHRNRQSIVARKTPPPAVMAGGRVPFSQQG
jgi:6-phosphofructokinase